LESDELIECVAEELTDTVSSALAEELLEAEGDLLIELDAVSVALPEAVLESKSLLRLELGVDV
jgi:hypothetical protein